MISAETFSMASAQANPTVLVVDDDPDILEALTEILESEGFRTRKAKNGKEALERLAPNPPELILLDLMMPVMDGWEFSQELKKKPGVSKVPVIVLSADRTVGARAKELGAVGYLGKPFELEDLLKMVRSALDRSAA